MSQVKFFKVNSLPAQLSADSWYLVLNGDFVEIFVTDAAGNAKSAGNSQMISAIAQKLINQSLSDFNALEIVSDITARNALASGKQRNFIALVTDATGDSSVKTGAALYAWNEGTSKWTKLSEFESMDVTLQWANIADKPNSSVAQIDDAVTKRHSHSNLPILEKINVDSSGAMTFNGEKVAAAWEQVNW